MTNVQLTSNMIIRIYRSRFTLLLFTAVSAAVKLFLLRTPTTVALLAITMTDTGRRKYIPKSIQAKILAETVS